jgi:hypothetical protein
MLDEALREGFDLALLFSEIGAAYYRRFGFVETATFESTLRVTESPHRGAPATLVRGGEERDLANVAEMGRVRAEPFAFHLDRDVDLVQYAIAKRRLLAGFGPAGAREVEFVVAEEGLKAVAYAVISVVRSGEHSAPRWILEECGDRDPAGARLGAILQTLIAREPSAMRPVISGWLPLGFQPPQITIVERQPSSEVMMLRGLRAPLPSVDADRVLYWHADLF